MGNTNHPVVHFCLVCFKKQTGTVKVCDRGTTFDSKLNAYLCVKHLR